MANKTRKLKLDILGTSILTAIEDQILAGVGYDGFFLSDVEVTGVSKNGKRLEVTAIYEPAQADDDVEEDDAAE